MAEWHFKPKEAGDTIREPIQSEFFTANAISDPGNALVREGIQNSLDAASDAKVIVRIRFVESGHIPDAKQVRPFMNGAWEHMLADSTGLDPQAIPPVNDSCPYIVFEDFGTTGLEGDPEMAFKPITGERNHFYHFFRAEGQSDKSESDRGSWGVGKTVFPRSSRISSMFGLTVRADDNRRLLMGRMILKSHYVGKDYYQDGYYGEPAAGGGKIILPIEDAVLIQEFCDVFDLQRGQDPGLSIVVPWPDAEIQEKAIARAVLSGYFYPIMIGQLEVLVETEGVEAIFSNVSIESEIQDIGDDFSADLLPLLRLTKWAIDLPDEERVVLETPSADRAWQWSRELFPDEKLLSLRKHFEQGDRIAIRVPVTVRAQSGSREGSFFDVFMERDPNDKRGQPIFVRDGIIIPNVRPPRTRGVRAIVIVTDQPLASFLRNAENPSHTEWQHDGSNFRGKYVSGRSDLEFLRRCVHETTRILMEETRDEDPMLLIDLFSLPAQAEEPPTRIQKPGTEAGAKPTPTIKIPPPKPEPYRVSRSRDGFSIRPGPVPMKEPFILEIRVAYDVRRGNPLLNYNISDFDLSKDPIKFEPKPQGVKIISVEENTICIEVMNPDFRFTVVGFDEKRDLYVRTGLKEELDASTQI